MKKLLITSGLAAATVLGVGMAHAPAQALSLTFEGDDNFGSDPIKVNLDLIDLGSNIKFTVSIAPETANGTNNIADLTGFFFDVANESLLPSLSIENAQTTNANGITNTVDAIRNPEFSANNVRFSGGGTANFDAGFSIGASNGLGSQNVDDIRSIMFEVASSSGDLDLSLFDRNGIRAGVRAQSVGPEGSDRSGSAKIAGEVPTPAILPGLIGMSIAALRKKNGEDVEEEA